MSDNNKFEKTFSTVQLQLTKDMIRLQNELDTRIQNKIQETMLHYTMNKEELSDEIDKLEDSIKYILDERIRFMRVLVQNAVYNNEE